MACMRSTSASVVNAIDAHVVKRAPGCIHHAAFGGDGETRGPVIVDGPGVFGRAKSLRRFFQKLVLERKPTDQPAPAQQCAPHTAPGAWPLRLRRRTHRARSSVVLDPDTNEVAADVVTLGKPMKAYLAGQILLG